MTRPDATRCQLDPRHAPSCALERLPPWRRTARRGTASLILALAPWAAPMGAGAQSTCFIRLTDDSSAISAWGVSPALHAGKAAFLGTQVSSGIDGIWTMASDGSGAYELVVNDKTIVPNESFLSFFYFLQNPAIRDGVVAFTGGDTTNQDGIYLGGFPGPLVTLLDSEGPAPSPNPNPSMGLNGVAFTVGGGFTSAWYVDYETGAYQMVAGYPQPIPGGGTFVNADVGVPAMGDEIMAIACLASHENGADGALLTWNSTLDQMDLVANWNTPMPGHRFNFDFFLAADTDDQTVAFVGKNGYLGFGGTVGIYTAPVGAGGAGPIAVVAEAGDAAPGGGVFTSFGPVAIDGETLIFGAALDNPVLPSEFGIYGRIGDGPIFRIVGTGQPFMGHDLIAMDWSHRCLDDNQLVFRATVIDQDVAPPTSYWTVVATIDPAGVAQCPSQPTLPPPVPGLDDCHVWFDDFGPESDGLLTAREMAVIAEDDIWVVGDAGVATHFDGTSWTVTPVPTVAGATVNIQGVSVTPEGDVWAAGYYGLGSQVKGVVLHWTGAAWSVVTVPNPHPAKNWLMDIEAVSSTDIWVCGFRGDFEDFLMLHFDGTAWTVVTMPNVGAGSVKDLEGLSSTGPDDVWCVGAILPPGEDYECLIFHFDGTAWSKVADVPQPESSPYPYDVCAISPDLVWVCGDLFKQGQGHQPMTLRYDGLEWEVVPAPGPGAGWNFLFGIGGIDDDHVYAAGYHYYGAVSEPIALSWDPVYDIWVPHDLQMPGYSTTAWAAAALPNGEGLVAGTIGYYGSTPPDLLFRRFGKPGGQWDLDCDGAVNGADLGLMLNEMSTTAGSVADLSGDGKVDGAELGLLLAAWTE